MALTINLNADGSSTVTFSGNPLTGQVNGSFDSGTTMMAYQIDGGNCYPIPSSGLNYTSDTWTLTLTTTDCPGSDTYTLTMYEWNGNSGQQAGPVTFTADEP
jgi:hypothetical protein